MDHAAPTFEEHMARVVQQLSGGSAGTDDACRGQGPRRLPTYGCREPVDDRLTSPWRSRRYLKGLLVP
jgi:hypothetical protein